VIDVLKKLSSVYYAKKTVDGAEKILVEARNSVFILASFLLESLIRSSC